MINKKNTDSFEQEQKEIFSIIIPAYNEEQSIAQIIKRCLSAKDEIIKRTFIDEVEIIVVSDGSHDNTASIASQFVPNITLIAYEKNKGYGAAIKMGFKKSVGTYVSFLDADGTCNPLFFIDMLNKLKNENADICIGSRMGKNSKMPPIRRLGNLFFRSLINLIASSQITDSASGMRVIKRKSLNLIYPLPDGLHFTPAMSVRAIMDSKLKIIEIDMDYEERQGRSKLTVVRDGIRFLKIILSIALTYHPLRIIGSFALILIAISAIFGTVSLIQYLKIRMIPDIEIYRLIPVMVFGISGMLLLGISCLIDKSTSILNTTSHEGHSIVGRFIRWVFSWQRLIFLSPILIVTGLVMNSRSITSWISERSITTHWSYLVTGGFLILLGIIYIALAVIDYLFLQLKFKMDYLSSEEAKSEN